VTSQKRFVKEYYDWVGGEGVGGWMGLLRKSGLSNHADAEWTVGEGEKWESLREVHRWRDEIARKEDESTV
jgi:hypothetical protein